jgi:CIC family chloride channel protein
VRQRLRDMSAMTRLVLAAIVVGFVAAATAITIRVALNEGIRLLHGTTSIVAALEASPRWVRIVSPIVGAFAAGLVVHLLLRRGSPAVADVMEAVALGRGKPRLGAAVVQAAGTIAAQIGGSSIGREGPLIQLGAGVGHELGTRITSAISERRALVAAGTAAGFAAAYNTPLAAVLFVLEVIAGVVTLDVVIPVAVATAVGSAVTRAVIGGGPIYGARAFGIADPTEYVAFAAVGVVGALAGLAFIALIAGGERTFGRIGAWPRPVRTAIGGLVVGVILLWRPDVAGNGFEPLHQILDGRVALAGLLVLAATKAFATTASVSSGTPGGVFTPTMVIGAAIGAAIGAVVAHVAPFGSSVTPGSYALVGMAATTAATTHAPLMATMLAFELSGDYLIVLPLLLATGISTLLARRLHPDSIYTSELRRRGIPREPEVRTAA